ncbi:MAG: aminoglycoside phosphotransferase family protein [Neisseriaceae bacterium]
MHKWQLEDIQPANNLSYNYIIYGYSKLYHTQIVLKIICDNSEFNQEKMCLLDFQGYGINKLLDYDARYNILFLEKIGDGTTLKSLFPSNENSAIEIVARIIKKLNETKKEFNQINYPTVLEWAGKIIKQCNFGQIDVEFIKLGHQLVDELLCKNNNIYESEHLLHGDLHHENILYSNSGDWISIDPKGVVGNIAYETGAFMRNPVPELLQHPNLEGLLMNRISKFSVLLELDKQLLIKYSYLCTLLATISNLVDNGNRWQDWIQLLPIFRSMF